MSSTELARPYLGQRLTAMIDRPLGSVHPQYGFEYLVNYGYVPGLLAPDGDELDVYVLGVDEPLTEFTGHCVAIVHRRDDDDDKLVLVPDGISLSDAQILSQIHFQEQYYDALLLRS